jgi:predicted CoA-substrate-specific enzyme activase
MTYVAGIDLGSRTAKAVILDEKRELKGKAIERTRPDFPELAQDVLNQALADAGLKQKDVNYIATTGYGRYNVPFRDIQITEITSAARGAAFLFPGTRSLVDIGFQGTRCVRVLEGGRVKEFRSNDKCAAGAGGFLERAARYLEVSLEDLGNLSLKADDPQTISSVCAVLAESEIINHVTAGATVENIVRGIHNSLAERAISMLRRVGIEEEVTFVGGVTKQAGMVAAMEEVLEMKVNVTPDTDYVAALGAAILALQRVEKAALSRSTSA